MGEKVRIKRAVEGKNLEMDTHTKGRMKMRMGGGGWEVWVVGESKGKEEPQRGVVTQIQSSLAAQRTTTAKWYARGGVLNFPREPL